jgi:hypothetical protein
LGKESSAGKKRGKECDATMKEGKMKTRKSEGRKIKEEQRREMEGKLVGEEGEGGKNGKKIRVGKRRRRERVRQME